MDNFAALRADMDREVRNLDRLSQELVKILAETTEGTSARVRATGSLIHDFYTGVEKIFRRIATRMDQDLPTGEDWHVQLLQRMAVSVEAIRPPVIDEILKNQLEEYLRFRHLFRNIYGFDLKWERCQPLVKQLDKTRHDLEEQIACFENFLSSI